MVQTYLQYNDPLLIHWRNEPYKDRVDSLPVINNQITLLEIPSKTHKVQIAGYTEIDTDTFNRNRKKINSNEFIVDYSVGNIQFNSSEEGKELLVSYKGRGIIMYPASRIYAMVSRSPNIVKTLQDLIDEVNGQIDTVNDYINEANTVIQQAIEATTKASVATDNANDSANKADIATQTAYDAAQYAVDAADSSIIIYKEPVDKYNDIFTTYPNPENGWRVLVQETGNIYRYDGIFENEWMLIGNYTQGIIPYASEMTSGLLHKDDYIDFIKRRIIFSLPLIRNTGVQDVIIQFPLKGNIVGASAYCNIPANLYTTEIDVEKVSSEDFNNEENWESIFSTNIIIEPNEYKGSEPVIFNSSVDEGDFFRVNIVNLDAGIQGTTIQLDIDI